MMARINFTEVQSQSFEAIPAGMYWLKITDATETATKNEGKLPAGTEGINWEFTVQAGKFENRKLWTNHWLHPRTLGMLKDMMAKLTDDEGELVYKDGELDTELDFDNSELFGYNIVAKVAVRQYEGDDRNDIKGFRRWDPEKDYSDVEESSGSFLP